MTGRAGQLVIHAVIVSLGFGTATGASVNHHCGSNTHLDSGKRRARSHRLDRTTTTITTATITWCNRGKVKVRRRGLLWVEGNISGSGRVRQRV